MTVVPYQEGAFDAIRLLATMLMLGCGTVSGAEGTLPERGVASSVPARRRDCGFLRGNGRIGAPI